MLCVDTVVWNFLILKLIESYAIIKTYCNESLSLFLLFDNISLVLVGIKKYSYSLLVCNVIGNYASAAIIFIITCKEKNQ